MKNESEALDTSSPCSCQIAPPAGGGVTMPEPGRGTTRYWVSTTDEARKAVQELAARNVDIVKIWVDDRNGTVKKMTPEIYTAVIDEAHKNKLRATAHIFTLDDAKGLLPSCRRPPPTDRTRSRPTGFRPEALQDSVKRGAGSPWGPTETSAGPTILKWPIWSPRA
jgi:hypothetical protein